MKRMGQGGFATLEVLLMVTVMGILAAIAVPRFTDVTTRANTAKVQSDLTAIDTAVSVYNLRTGDYPNDIPALVTSKDLQDKVSPPRGKVYVTESTCSILTITNTMEYALNTDHRATLDSKTAGVFYYDSSKTYGK